MNPVCKDVDSRYRSGVDPPKLLSMDCHTCRKYKVIELFLCCWMDGTQPTAYCSLECQQTDWNRHRTLCTRNTRTIDRLRSQCDKEIEKNKNTMHLLESTNKELNRKQIDMLKLNECIYRKDERIKDLERIVDKTNSDKKSTLEFAKQQEIEKEAWTKLAKEVEDRISTNVKLEQKVAEDSKKLNDMRNNVKNLMDRFMEEKSKHKAELAKLQSQLGLLNS